MFLNKSNFKNINNEFSLEAYNVCLDKEVYLIYTQIEMIGVQDFIKDSNKLLDYNKFIKNKLKTKYSLLSFIDLEEGKTYFFSQDDKVKNLVNSELKISFENNISIYDNLILRKEFIPMIRNVYKKFL